MEYDIIVPSVGESVTEAVLAQWLKQDGDAVAKEDPLFVMETDKITQEIAAEAEGALSILTPEGETVAVGEVIGKITAGATAASSAPEDAEKASEPETPAPAASDEESDAGKSSDSDTPEGTGSKPESKPESASTPDKTAPSETDADLSDQFPSVRRLLSLHGIRPDQISGTGPNGRITKGDVVLFLESGAYTPPSTASSSGKPEDKPSGPKSSDQKSSDQKKGDQKKSDREKSDQKSAPVPSDAEETVRRKPMTPIRKRISERLLEARRNTAMLTTFNDIDMTRAMEIRKAYKDRFAEKHGISLGFMSFFVKAAVTALQEFPAINAFIEGDEIVYHDYQHIGVAVGSPKGLVVPVLRFTERMSFADVEKGIAALVEKIQNNRLALADLEGGTFTISNGGVFGSLLSTPILNTPQSGILGMHKIEKRPVVVDDEIVIRPMMYVALSYDHRIVDGKEAVTFLKRIKECVEHPERMLMEV